MSCLSQRLIEFRKEKKVIQTDVAAAIGITVRAYQRYEYGEREPTASVLAAIADFYGVSIDYLMGRTDNPAVNR